MGIRTSILVALFGAVSTFLDINAIGGIFLISFIALLVMIIISHITLNVKYSRIGITTEISTILLFIYGAMCTLGLMQLAVTLGILTTLVLSTRSYLHKFALNISNREFYDTIKFAIIAFIILPFLPNESFDNTLLSPFLPPSSVGDSLNAIEVLNPYKIWMLIVFVSGVSFLGYILIKAFGKKAGISLTGLMGGLYSSTATSLTLAGQSKHQKTNLTPYVTGIIFACATSFIKGFIFIRALNAELFNRTLLPLSLMFIYLLIAGLVFYKNRKNTKMESNKSFDTPFTLSKGIKTGAFIITALLITKITLSYAGIELYYLFAVLSAFLSVDDPVVISTATAAGKLMSMADAKNIILIVVFLNMVQKTVIAKIFGNPKLVKPLAITFAGLFLVTLIGLFYL